MRKANSDHPGRENKSLHAFSTLVGVGVFVFSFAFYVLTLAPTVIWGDNASYAVAAIKMN